MLTAFERKQIVKELADEICGNNLLSMEYMVKLTGKNVRGVKDMCKRKNDPMPCHIKQGAWVFVQKEISAYFSAEKD